MDFQAKAPHLPLAGRSMKWLSIMAGGARLVGQTCQVREQPVWKEFIA